MKKTKREQEYKEENAVPLNEWQEVKPYNASKAETAFFKEHTGLHIETLAEEEDKRLNDYKGKQVTGRIIKVGKTQRGNIWIYFQVLNGKDKNALIVKPFSPEKFVSMLDGINGIYVTEEKDAEGWTVGDNITMTPEELTDRLKGCRICYLDNEPIKIKN